MKKFIPTFDQYLNEQEDSTGFNPMMSTDKDITGKPLTALNELIPGKEYVITLDGETFKDMVYSGVTDGYYIFNEVDHNEEPMTFSMDAMLKVIDAKGIAQVAM